MSPPSPYEDAIVFSVTTIAFAMRFVGFGFLTILFFGWALMLLVFFIHVRVLLSERAKLHVPLLGWAAHGFLLLASGFFVDFVVGGGSVTYNGFTAPFFHYSGIAIRFDEGLSFSLAGLSFVALVSVWVALLKTPQRVRNP